MKLFVNFNAQKHCTDLCWRDVNLSESPKAGDVIQWNQRLSAGSQSVINRLIITPCSYCLCPELVFYFQPFFQTIVSVAFDSSRYDKTSSHPASLFSLSLSESRRSVPWQAARRVIARTALSLPVYSHTVGQWH